MMERMSPIRGLLALVLASLCAVGDARVASGKMQTEGGKVLRPMLRPHGLDGGAQAVLNIDGLRIEDAKEEDKAEIGFFMSRERNKEQLERSLMEEGGCILHKESVVTLVQFSSIEGQSHRVVYDIPEDMAGEYTPWFTVCKDGPKVSFSYNIDLFNVRDGARDYLSSGEAPLPAMYLAFFACFALASFAWAYLLYKRWQNVFKIHLLMQALVFFKAMTLLCQSGMYNLLRWQGDSEGWNYAYYAFTFARGIFLFTVIVLIGTGWSFVKPYLASREKQVIAVVIPLQVLANIAIIFLDEGGPSVKGWFTWRDIFHLLDIICCCAVLFPIVWSIKHLRDAAGVDGKAARNVQKLALFRQFYILVVCYVYFTRIVVYLLRSTSPYPYVWLSYAANELATLAFYVITAWKFMPHERNPYLQVEMEDMETAELDDFDDKSAKHSASHDA